MGLNDAAKLFYLYNVNSGYIIQPYSVPELIGSDMITSGTSSSVKEFTQPRYANRLIVHLVMKGTITGGTLRVSCSNAAAVSNFQDLTLGAIHFTSGSGQDITLSSASSNSVYRFFSNLGPFHFVKVRVTANITGGGSVDAYVSAWN